MNDKSLPESDSSSGSVFNIFRSDRYTQFETEDEFAVSPPMHDFPEPIRFKPRKSKFHSLHDDDLQAHTDIKTETSLPKIIVASKSPASSLSRQIVSGKFTTRSDCKRGCLDGGSPHGSIEVSPAESSSVTLFEKARRLTPDSSPSTLRKSPVDKDNLSSPLTVGRVNKKDTDSDQQTMIISVQTRDEKSMVSLKNGGGPKSESSKEAIKSEKTVELKAKPMDGVDGNLSITGAVGAWLFGGQKTINVQNKDMNVIGPTSF